MTCVILQPSYVPWRGFFDQIRRADVFVWYDDVQFDKHGWRNRNRVKTVSGTRWLTIPVSAKGSVSEHREIRHTRIDWSTPWNRSHLDVIRQAYRDAPHLNVYLPLLESFLGDRHDEFLADLTIPLTEAIAGELGYGPKFFRSSALGIVGEKTERLVKICQSLGADRYISGPSARDYLDVEKFAQAGIAVEFMTYDYPPYEQMHGEFDPQVSILDLLFMKGSDAPRYIHAA